MASPVLHHARRAHIVLLLTQLCYSGWQVIGSIALTSGAANPLVFATHREILATAMMYIFVRLQGHTLYIEAVDIPRFFLMGICSFVNVVGTSIALQFITPTRYSIMQPSIPVWGTLISAAMGYERLTLRRSFGITLAVSGAVIMKALGGAASSEGGDGDPSEDMIGMGIVIAQCISMALLTVLQKPMVAKYPSWCVTCMYYCVGAAVTVLVLLSQSQHLNLPELSFHGDHFAWIALLYAAIFATLFAYNAIGYAVGHLAPGVVTLYSTLQPVCTVCLSFLVWARVPTFNELIGGGFVALGLLASVSGRPSAEAVAGANPYVNAKWGKIDGSNTDGSKIDGAR